MKPMRKTVNYKWLKKKGACQEGLTWFHKKYGRGKSVCIMELLHECVAGEEYFCEISNGKWLLRHLSMENSRFEDYEYSIEGPFIGGNSAFRNTMKIITFKYIKSYADWDKRYRRYK